MLVENHDFLIPPCIRRNIAIPFGAKTRMVCLPDGEKIEDMFSRFDRIPACDRQTGGHTDILRRHRPRYAYHRAVTTAVLWPVLSDMLQSLWLLQSIKIMLKQINKLITGPFSRTTQSELASVSGAYFWLTWIRLIKNMHHSLSPLSSPLTWMSLSNFYDTIVCI